MVKPLNTLRRWLAEENYGLVLLVKARIIRRYPDMNHEALVPFLEDSYLAACRCFNLEARQPNGKRVYFSTYAVKSMEMSGFRNWFQYALESIEWSRDSLDYRDEAREGDPPILDALAVESDPLPALYTIRDGIVRRVVPDGERWRVTKEGP